MRLTCAISRWTHAQRVNTGIATVFLDHAIHSTSALPLQLSLCAVDSQLELLQRQRVKSRTLRLAKDWFCAAAGAKVNKHTVLDDDDY